MKLLSTVAVFCSVLMVGCVTTGPHAEGLVGSWNVDDGPQTLIVAQGAEPQRYAISGHDGCNRYSGDADLRDGALVIGPLASTRRLCGDREGMQSTHRYMQRLTAQPTDYQQAGDTLTLTTAAGVLSFSRAQ